MCSDLPGTCAIAFDLGTSSPHLVNCSLADGPFDVPTPGSTLAALRPTFFCLPKLYIVRCVVPTPTNPTSPRSTPAICPSSHAHSPAINCSRSSRHAFGRRPSFSKPGSCRTAPEAARSCQHVEAWLEEARTHRGMSWRALLGSHRRRAKTSQGYTTERIPSGRIRAMLSPAVWVAIPSIVGLAFL